MSQAVKLTLVATAKYNDAQGRMSQKIGTVTLATVKLSNGIIVAGATLGGKYTPDQVLMELRHNPQRFKRHTGWDSAALAGLVR